MTRAADRQTDNSAGVSIEYLSDHRESVPTVAKWIYDEWSFLYPGKTIHFIEALLRKRLHKRKLPLTLVAYKAGMPVGTVSLKESELESRMDLRPWVTSLYVAKRWRGKGIGACLMKSIEQKAARFGIRKLYLFTADSGLASRFYKKLGWKIRERTELRMYRIILMEKEVG